MKIQNIRYWTLVTDLLWLPAALGLAIGLRCLDASEPVVWVSVFQNYALVIICACLIWGFLYFEMSLDGFKGGWHLPAFFSKVIVAVFLLMMGVLAVAFVTRHYYSRLVLLYFALFLALGLIGMRCLTRSLVTSLLSTEENRCVILGNDAVARELAGKIASHPELPFHVVGFLFPRESDAMNGSANSIVASPSIKTLQVLRFMEQQKIKKVIVGTVEINGAEVRKLISECRRASIQVYAVPQPYDLYTSRAELTEIDGLPLLSLREHNPPAINVVLKRALDVVLSFAMLIMVLPVLLFGVFVTYCKKGRAFRAEIRCGKNGVPFKMYRLNIERSAPNLAPHERIFVKWSLTELPQLWNVLRGDMSLVGPRPESPERVKYYSDWQRQRLKVSAGVTGFAQVHGLREQHPSQEKARFDLQYISNWSPLLDLSLILQTVWTLLSRGFANKVLHSESETTRGSAHDLVTPEVGNANRS